MRILRLLPMAICATLALLAGCSDPETPSDPLALDGPDKRVHPSGGASWTVLVYMVADNDLEPAALRDLEEMMQVGGSQDFRLLVQLDRAAGYSDDPIGGLAAWSGAKRLEVREGELVELADLGPANLATSDALADFLKWGHEVAPADRTALVLWDHGAAWAGFGLDESASDRLSIEELATGISLGVHESGMGQLALLGFDACLMGTAEVYLTLRPYAEYMIASSALVPGHGWDYTALSHAASAPTTGPVELGEAILEAYLSFAEVRGTADAITMTLVDLYALDPLAAFVEEWGETMAKHIDDAAAVATRSAQGALRFGRSPDRTHDFEMVDLLHWAQNYARDVSQPASTPISAVRGAIVEHVSGPLTKTSSGIAIHLPGIGRHDDARPAAPEVPDMNRWMSFRDALIEAAAQQRASGQSDPRVPRLEAGELAVYAEEATTPDDLPGYYWDHPLVPETAEFLARQESWVGYADGDRTVFLLSVVPGLHPLEVEAGEQDLVDATAFGYWDGMLFRLTQGELAAPAFVAVREYDSGFAFDVPMYYREEGQPDRWVVWTMAYGLPEDPDGLATETDNTLYVYEGGFASPLVASASGRLVPALWVQREGQAPGWEPGEDLGFTPEVDWSADPSDFTEPGELLFIDQLPFTAITADRDLVIQLTVESFAGLPSTVSYRGTPPPLTP